MTPTKSAAPARRFPEDCAPAPRQCVLNVAKSGAWETVGGIPLVARMLYHLDKIGIREVFAVSDTNGIPVDLEKWLGGIRLREVRTKPGKDVAAAILAIPDIDRRFLYMDAAHLMDVRLIKALASASDTTLAFANAEDAKDGVIRAGLLHVEHARIWDEQGDVALVQHSQCLLPQSIDPFSPEMRGPLTPYFFHVRSKSEAVEATRLLIRSQQKHVMDLPAEFIDPLFENPLTFWLCQTPVTPNMVSLAGCAVAVFVAWLFWHAHFAVGALLMFLVEVLDGTDGKLARTKLQFSRFGRHEDILDYFCETGLYVALGVGLSSTTSNGWPYWLAALLILSDTVDNILYTLAGKWYGKSIDLFRPFDAVFRRFAGRRNIYCAMFIVGFLLGFPLQTFTFTAIWAAVTAAVHLVRIIQFGEAARRLRG